ncbi:hypothetical protein U1Q18_036862 [Sarracenia purpurea var. burkii]
MCNPALGEVLIFALLSVNHHHHVGDLHPRGPERSDGLKDGSVVGEEVLDGKTDLVVPEGALDGLGGTVVLDLFARHDHGDIRGSGYAGGNGKGGVGDAIHEVVWCGWGEGRDGGLGDLAEEGRVGDD